MESGRLMVRIAILPCVSKVTDMAIGLLSLIGYSESQKPIEFPRKIQEQRNRAHVYEKPLLTCL
jgi:hypothetical protein